MWPEDLTEIESPEAFDAMVEALVDDFVLLGFSDERILELFRSPRIDLTNSVLKLKGEGYVKAVIRKVGRAWKLN